MAKKVTGTICLLVLILAGCAGQAEQDLPMIDVFQFSNNSLVDATRDGFLAEMAEAGYVDGENVSYYFHNAEGDRPTAQLIAQQIAGSRSDLVFVASTPALEAILNQVEDKSVVFGAVANPYAIGAGESPENHRPNVTGASATSPIREAMTLMLEVLPSASRAGVIFDPGLANSAYNIGVAREAANHLGVELVEASVGSSTDVLEAAEALAAKGIDAFYVIPDHMVMDAFDALVKVADSEGIPTFSSVTDLAADGAAVCIGWDYSENGRQSARILLRIIDGESPADIPFQSLERTLLAVNLRAAADQGLVISDELLARADVVIE